MAKAWVRVVRKVRLKRMVRMVLTKGGRLPLQNCKCLFPLRKVPLSLT